MNLSISLWEKLFINSLKKGDPNIISWTDGEVHRWSSIAGLVSMMTKSCDKTKTLFEIINDQNITQYNSNYKKILAIELIKRFEIDPRVVDNLEMFL